jgi:hypothetical protein
MGAAAYALACSGTRNHTIQEGATRPPARSWSRCHHSALPFAQKSSSSAGLGVSDSAVPSDPATVLHVTDVERSTRATPRKVSRPEPVRRRGEPFFDQLVEDLYPPALVRRALHVLVQEQYGEADRIAALRVWGGAQPHGNDRYQYSLEQQRRLSSLIPGAELLRPTQSLLYRIAGALVYPMRYGSSAYDCPTSAEIDDDSEIQTRLAAGRFDDPPTLFDPPSFKPRTVVWLLFTGNNVEGGPLSAYLALPGGPLPERRIHWLGIEPLFTGSEGAAPDSPAPGQPPRSSPPPSEPSLPLRLRS